MKRSKYYQTQGYKIRRPQVIVHDCQLYLLPKNGLLTSAQHVGHGIIEISDTCCYIDHENNCIGLFNRDHNLLPDLFFKNIFTVRVQTLPYQLH